MALWFICYVVDSGKLYKTQSRQWVLSCPLYNTTEDLQEIYWYMQVEIVHVLEKGISQHDNGAFDCLKAFKLKAEVECFAGCRGNTDGLEQGPIMLLGRFYK